MGGAGARTLQEVDRCESLSTHSMEFGRCRYKAPMTGPVTWHPAFVPGVVPRTDVGVAASIEPRRDLRNPTRGYPHT